MSVPSTAGTTSSFCDQETRRTPPERVRIPAGPTRQRGARGGGRYLGVEDAVDDAGGGEVEDAGAAPRSGEHGGAVEEVAPEEADAALVAGGGGERAEVVRLGLVICAMPTKSTLTDLRRIAPKRCGRTLL